MATHDYVIANGSGAAVRSDLNDALAAVVSQNSSATAPATTYAYMRWADTTAGVMKMRNGANSAWITLYQLDGEYTTIAIENGTAAAPSIYFKDSGTDTGIYSPGADQVAISTGGILRFSISTSAVSSSLAIDHPLGAVGTPSITFTGDLNTGVWSPAADVIAVSTGGSERGRIASTGELLIGKTSVTSNGGVLQVSNGITFPATQVTCSDANTLDDYEEGTWTPNVGAGVTAGGTVSTSGYYIKIGKQVTVWCAFSYTSSLTLQVSKGGVVCTNLPFVSSGSGSVNGSPGFGIDWNYSIALSCAVVSSTIYNGPALPNNYSATYCITYTVS